MLRRAAEASAAAGAAGWLPACGAFGTGETGGTAPADDVPVKLTYLHQWAQNQGHGPATDKFTARFSEEHPTTQVEGVYTAQYYEKLAAIIAGGDLPDIVTYNLVFAPQLIRRNVTVPAESLSRGQYRFDKNDLVTAAREMATFDGKVALVPYVMNASGMGFNQTLFRQSGLDPNRPPAVWNELVDMGKRLTKSDADVWGVQFPRSASDPISMLLAFHWQNGGELVDMGRRVATWNSPEGVEALQFQVDLVHRHQVAKVDLANNAREQGKLGIWFMPPGNVNVLERAVAGQFDWSTAVLPKGKRAAGTVGGHSLAVMKTNRHHDRAWRFVHWFVFGQGAQHVSDYVAVTSTLPASKTSERAQPWRRYVTENPRIKPYVDTLGIAQATPKLSRWEEIIAILETARESAATQKQTVKEALDEAARLAEPLIKEG
jgi:ABC-type glycerol-3-phosphate transport system substrate-binding protein